uniref:Dynein light chain Tctex-type 1 n=2 Tax=Xiphophorus maculatus TaxID=8083 RepID=M4ABY2_XIPMA
MLWEERGAHVGERVRHDWLWWTGEERRRRSASTGKTITRDHHKEKRQAVFCMLTGMEEYTSGDDGNFNTDETSVLVKECIEGVIGGTDYNHNKVNQWTANIVEHSLTHLVKQGRPFKYIVNCTIMQKSGAGLHTASSCYWDTTTDGSCTVRWENRTMYCVVSVFAVAM